MQGWPNHPSIFLSFSFSFILDFFLNKIKYVIGAFWEKKVKVVELSQFESLEG